MKDELNRQQFARAEQTARHMRKKNCVRGAYALAFAKSFRTWYFFGSSHYTALLWLHSACAMTTGRIDTPLACAADLAHACSKWPTMASGKVSGSGRNYRAVWAAGRSADLARAHPVVWRAAQQCIGRVFGAAYANRVAMKQAHRWSSSYQYGAIAACRQHCALTADRFERQLAKLEGSVRSVRRAAGAINIKHKCRDLRQKLYAVAMSGTGPRLKLMQRLASVEGIVDARLPRLIQPSVDAKLRELKEHTRRARLLISGATPTMGPSASETLIGGNATAAVLRRLTKTYSRWLGVKRRTYQRRAHQQLNAWKIAVRRLRRRTP